MLEIARLYDRIALHVTLRMFLLDDIFIVGFESQTICHHGFILFMVHPNSSWPTLKPGDYPFHLQDIGPYNR